MEAPSLRWERVIQFPGRGCTAKEPKLVPEEFVAEENINYWKDMSASEEANADDRTVKTTNLPLTPQKEKHQISPNEDHSPSTPHL
jgi:hypothetical protein